MSTQVKINQGSRIYNPDRDVAYNFVSVGRRVGYLLNSENRSADIAILVQQLNATDATLGGAVKAFAQVLTQAYNEEASLAFEQALERAGWWSGPAGGRLAVCATLGFLMLSIYFQGIREVTAPETGEPKVIKQFVDEATAACAATAGMSRLRRYLRRVRLALLSY